jgi:hypothetical protein
VDNLWFKRPSYFARRRALATAAPFQGAFEAGSFQGFIQAGKIGAEVRRSALSRLAFWRGDIKQNFARFIDCQADELLARRNSPANHAQAHDLPGIAYVFFLVAQRVTVSGMLL